MPSESNPMLDFATRNRIARNAYQRASSNYLRAKTIHAREQARGQVDGSVQQTRRMYFAVTRLQYAARRYADAQRVLFQG